MFFKVYGAIILRKSFIMHESGLYIKGNSDLAFNARTIYFIISPEYAFHPGDQLFLLLSMVCLSTQVEIVIVCDEKPLYLYSKFRSIQMAYFQQNISTISSNAVIVGKLETVFCLKSAMAHNKGLYLIFATATSSIKEPIATYINNVLFKLLNRQLPGNPIELLRKYLLSLSSSSLKQLESTERYAVCNAEIISRGSYLKNFKLRKRIVRQIERAHEIDPNITFVYVGQQQHFINIDKRIPVIDLSGLTDIGDLISLISSNKCEMSISPDGFIFHLASIFCNIHYVYFRGRIRKKNRESIISSTIPIIESRGKYIDLQC